MRLRRDIDALYVIICGLSDTKLRGLYGIIYVPWDILMTCISSFSDASPKKSFALEVRFTLLLRDESRYQLVISSQCVWLILQIF